MGLRALASTVHFFVVLLQLPAGANSVQCFLPFANAFQVTAENSVSPEWSLIIDLGATDII